MFLVRSVETNHTENGHEVFQHLMTALRQQNEA